MHIGLLRAINVGGRNMVAMSDLRDLLEALGFARVRSLLQSGNLIFESNELSGASLEQRLEVETTKSLGVTVDYIVRSAAEWQTIIANNPFPNEATRDASHLVVMFLKTAPNAKNVKALEGAIRGPEVIRADGKQLYVTYPAGIGRSKLTGTLIEQILNSRGTARNWNTILKLAALLGK
jgi:uncharacterized protein (DUF1697 family)